MPSGYSFRTRHGAFTTSSAALCLVAGTLRVTASMASSDVFDLPLVVNLPEQRHAQGEPNKHWHSCGLPMQGQGSNVYLC